MEAMTLDVDDLLIRIRELRQTIAEFEAERDEAIKAAKELCDRKNLNAQNEIADLTAILRCYFETNCPEDKKTMNFCHGHLQLRKTPPKFHYEEAQLLEFCKANAPEFVKVKTSEVTDWAELKKHLTIDDGKVFFNDTGELIAGMTAQESPDKFEIKTA